MRRNSASAFSALIVPILYCHTALAKDGSCVPTEPTTSYEHHIFAVDEDGNALRPKVKKCGTGYDARYSATHVILEDEDVRRAKVQHHGPTQSPCDTLNDQMQVALRGRKPLYDYLEAMFADIRKSKPKEIIIYIHGGLNNIDSAIAKSALLADRVGPDVYFIGICWNSNLMPTYDQHLLGIREGLHEPTRAILTVPAMLLADIGGAAARLPLNATSFIEQDLYTAYPRLFGRRRLAERRYDQIKNAAKNSKLQGLTVMDAKDQRPEVDRVALDFGRWLVTYPIKLPSTLLLDIFGVQPWKNMLRRTRTMFERESEFIPHLTYRDALALAKCPLVTHEQVNATQLLDQLNYTGRKGAMWHFCRYLATGLWPRSESKCPKVTLIGHSMGAIVSCEMLQRFHAMPLDNVVFEAAACSIADFKTKVVPFLQEQNLRAQIAEMRPPNTSHVVKTHFYNLCLHDDAENSEKNPGEFDLSQRGSLLTWIDTLYQSPESENDRTFGRWVNAILATDDFPSDILDRITIKEFGRDRPRKEHEKGPVYTEDRRDTRNVVTEPIKHGQMTRFEQTSQKRRTNFKFWSKEYWKREPPSTTPSPSPH
ncbi:MAG: hypothetical protein DMF24_11980 [Verrucomicrobia bacterium]|nr:MAG: hypothetical protein DMF24_11980 [Verrucomicrobiota bacterium]